MGRILLQSPSPIKEAGGIITETGTTPRDGSQRSKPYKQTMNTARRLHGTYLVGL
jgi:hypothetical protein